MDGEVLLALCKDAHVLPLVVNGKINIIRNNHTLVLVGKAKSFYQKQLAQECLRKVVASNDLKLKNEIVVE